MYLACFPPWIHRESTGDCPRENNPRGCGDDTPTGSGPQSPGVAETPHPPGCATTGTRRFASGGAARQKGNSVNFGGYFHGRLYLDGTVSGDGRITGANSVNIRLIKGVKWALAASDFSFMNIVDDKTPVVDFAISSAGAARGKLVKGQSVLVNGTTFGENAADVAVRFAYGDGAEATATVTGCGENLISIAWPDELSALSDGTEVSIVVIRTSGSATYVSTPRSAIVVG